MARVPSSTSLSNVQRSLIPQLGGRTRATPGAFGAQIGRAQAEAGANLIGAGEQGATIAIEMLHESNQRELKNADKDQSEMEHLIWSGDGTAENPGLGNLEGQFALDEQINAATAREKGMKKIRKGLSSDYLRGRFNEMSSLRQQAAEARSSDHITKQSKVANARIADIRQAAAVRDAATDYNNEVQMNHHFAIAQAEAISGAMNRGVRDQEILDAVAEEAQSKVARTAIEAAIANDDVVLAKELLKSYKKGKRIFGDDLLDMKKALKVGTTRVNSQIAFDNILLQFPGDYRAQNKEARKLKGEVRDETLKRLSRFQLEERTAKTMDDLNRDEQANAWVQESRDIIDFPDFDLLTPTQRQTYEEASRNKAAGAPTLPNYAAMEYVTKLSTAELARVQLGLLQANVSPEQFKVAEKLVVNARQRIANPTAKGDLKVTNPVTMTRKFNGYADSIEDLEPHERGQLQVQFDNEVVAAQAKKGEQLTNEEMDVILRNLFDGFAEVTLKGGFWEGGLFDTDIRLKDVIEKAQSFGDQGVLNQLLGQFVRDNKRAPSDLELARLYTEFLEREN